MAKKNGIKTYVSIAGIILTLLAIIVSFVKGYTKLEGQVANVEGKVKSIKETNLPNIEGDLDYHDDRLYETEKEVFGLKKEFGYLADKVDRNLEEQQKFQLEQRGMQKEIITSIKELHK